MSIRTWTAAFLISVSVCVVRHGVTVVAFSIDESFSSKGEIRQKIAPYREYRMTATVADKVLLALASDEAVPERIKLVSSALAHAPLSSAEWLELSQARLVAGLPPEKIFAALALSNLTGPNESYLMAHRAVFAIPLWISLPPKLQHSLIADMVSGGFAGMTAEMRSTIRFVLSQSNDRAREEMRAALLLNGKKGVEISESLGLEPANTRSRAVPANSSDMVQ